MKNLLRILLVATSFLPFLSLHSQKLSPQAQAVLNRIPPEQRAMALQEANRLRGQPRGELSTQSSQSTGGEPKAEIKAEVNTQDSVEKEDELLVLTELELALRADITQEKESLDEAKIVTERGEECCFSLADECMTEWKRYFQENGV